MNELSIIIPSRNAANLAACVGAIRDHGETARIIVVDDGLILDGAPVPFRTRDMLVTGARPFVFARNINIGIEAAGRDSVLLLNDDALLQERSGFSQLYTTAMVNPEFGIISSACNNVGNMNQHRQNRGLREEPRQVCFVAVLIPRSTIDKIGGLDERFGSGGFEDDDFCLRIRRAGLKIGIFDGTFVDHGALQSTFRGPGGPGYNPLGAQIFREKWGAGNHDL